MRRAMLSLLVLLLLIAADAMAAPQSSEDKPPALNIQDTSVTVKLLSPISTKTSQRGDTFTAQVLSPAQLENAVMEGKVTSLRKAKKGTGKSEILFAFQTITVGDKTYPITADLKEVTNSKGVKEVDDEGRAIGRTSMKKTAASAAAGAALGALLVDCNA